MDFTVQSTSPDTATLSAETALVRIDTLVYHRVQEEFFSHVFAAERCQWDDDGHFHCLIADLLRTAASTQFASTNSWNVKFVRHRNAIPVEQFLFQLEALTESTLNNYLKLYMPVCLHAIYACSR